MSIQREFRKFGTMTEEVLFQVAVCLTTEVRGTQSRDSEDNCRCEVDLYWE